MTEQKFEFLNFNSIFVGFFITTFKLPLKMKGNLQRACLSGPKLSVKHSAFLVSPHPAT